MWARLITRLVIALLKWARLSIEDRTLLTVALLDKLKALPVSDILRVENGSVLIEGKPIPMEQAIVLREGANRILNSPAWKIIQAQILFMATIIGVHEATSPEQVFFSKVAIWWHQEEKKLYERLAEQDGSDDGI